METLVTYAIVYPYIITVLKVSICVAMLIFILLLPRVCASSQRYLLTALAIAAWAAFTLLVQFTADVKAQTTLYSGICIEVHKMLDEK